MSVFEPPSRETATPAYVDDPLMRTPPDPTRPREPSRATLPPAPGPAQPRRRLWPWILAAALAAALVIAAAVTAGALLTTRDGDTASVTPQTAMVSRGQPCDIDGRMGDGVNGSRLRCENGRWNPVDTPTQEDPAPAVTPALSEFQLTVKVTSKQCFGSAGCNVEFKIEAGWAATFDPAHTWELTYEVTGPEDGPLIGTMEITGDQYTVPEHAVSTPRRSTKLTVKPTSIDKVGL